MSVTSPKVVIPEGAVRCVYYAVPQGSRYPAIVRSAAAATVEEAKRLTTKLMLPAGEYRADVEQYRAGHWCLIGRRDAVSSRIGMTKGVYREIAQ